MRIGRDWVGLDLYEILRVSPAAAPEEIRRAYRRQTRESHPDLFPGDVTRAARMRDLNLAARVLLDPGLRALYDRARCAAPRGTARAWWERGTDDACEWEHSVAPKPAPRVPQRLRGFVRTLRGRAGRGLASIDGWVLSFPPRGRLALGSVGVALALLLIALARPRPLGGDRPQPVSISPAALYP